MKHRIVFFILAILMTLAVYQGAYAAQETTVTLSFDMEQFLFDQVLGYDRVRLIDGSEGWIRAGFRDIQAEPASILDSRIGPDETQFRFKSDKQDFIDCVKTRQETIEPAEVGHRVTSLCHLGHIAIHTGRKLQWDPKRERFTNDDKANEYLDKPILARRTP